MNVRIVGSCFRLATLVVLWMLIGGCALSQRLVNQLLGELPTKSDVQLVEEYRDLTDQPTGVAVSLRNRMFVSFPRWGKDPQYSVAEILADGSLRPFPNLDWNSWDKKPEEADDHFVCVQSLYLDNKDNLWILDPASPAFGGVVKGGAKLVKVNLADDRIEKVINFPPYIAPTSSYFNSVSIDTEKNVAYITDSGSGAIVVTELGDGSSRRLLINHPSTKAEPGYTPILNGHKMLTGNGQPPQIHASGIALSHNKLYLYYHALTGRTLYRIRTEFLTNPVYSPEQVAAQVEVVEETSLVDGMWMDRKNNLFITLPEEKAIKRITAEGEEKFIVKDQRLEWPNSIAIGPGGVVYFTDSQINLMPGYNRGNDNRLLPYKVYKVAPKETPHEQETAAHNDAAGRPVTDNWLPYTSP